MANASRDGGFAQFVMSPVENVFVLGSPADGGLGWDTAQLGALSTASVPFGGLRAVDLKPGETVAIAPATGNFGSAGVVVALAMGARACSLWAAATPALTDLPVSPSELARRSSCALQRFKAVWKSRWKL